jgi:Transcriptional regulator
MNIDFELYRIFYVVANAGNITRASEELMISQPAVSKSIKNLENQIGGQLFTRTKRGVILTTEGEEFYGYIRQAIDFINSAESKFSDLINLEAGSIKIGISATLTKYFLLPYLEIFHNKYPKVDIQILTLTTSNMLPRLKNGLLDIIVANLPYDFTDDIKVVECKKVQDCFVVNEKFKHLTEKKLKLEDLNKHPLILMMTGSNTRAFIDDFAKKNGVILYPNMSLASYSLVESFARIGYGIGYVVKDFIKDDLKNKKLYELDIEPRIPKRNIGIAMMKNKPPSFSTRKLIEIIEEKK